MIKTFKRYSTKEAYDDIQVGDIPTGSIVVIEREQVIGIADTWPVTITKNHGEFHDFTEKNLTFDEKLAIMNDWSDFDFTESMEVAKQTMKEYNYS